MKNVECRNKNSALCVLKFFFILHSAFFISLAAHAATEFGDVSVSPAAIYTGNTFHGYAEMRVLVENRSHTKAHFVTLIFPNYAYNNGNSIGRLTRTVKVEPDTRTMVSLLQPPLPAQGDNQIRVEVDGHHEGEVRAPNGNNHCNNYSGRGGVATILVSRGLDFDAVEKLFQANGGAFTAAKAIGAPDAGSGGRQPDAWMPETRRGSAPNWLELDYAAPQTANKIYVHYTQPPVSSGTIALIGNAGTNLTTISMASGHNSSSGSGWDAEFTFPTTSELVKTVRLDFGRTPPYNISVDAVQLSGPTGSQWASDARASSDNSAAASAYSPSSVNAESITSLRAESPVSEWSENWLAYSPFDSVVIGAADLAAMSPAVTSALGDYLSAGGNVVLLGATELPAAWHPVQKKKLIDGFENKIGFGVCLAFPAANPSALVELTVERVRELAHGSARYWQSLPGDSTAANSVLPVVENLRIPVRGIVIIMIAFIIVIGPVNIFYLSRRNRRVWMLWTIPVISFATTLLVFVYSLLREGITPDARIVGITVLDQTSHRAATTGGEAFYCPLTPSGGLNFDYDTEATPLVEAGYGSGTSREVDWTLSQHFLRGWISARVPAHFHVRKPETRRERIQVVNENGQLQIVNSLGANIKTLWFADAKMKLYQANNVVAGQKAALISSSSTQVAEKLGAGGLWHDLGFAARTDSLGDSAGKYLLPNSYIAVLEGNPFLENALGSASSAKRTKSSAVVFGILESPDAK